MASQYDARKKIARIKLEREQVPRAAQPASPVDTVAPTEGVITAAMLLEKLGAHTAVGSGSLLRLEFSMEDRPLCLDVRCVQGTVVVGKISCDEDVLWEEQIDLRTFDVAQVARAAIADPRPAPKPPSASDRATASFGSTATSGYGLPVAGEVWCMNLEVIQENADEVRYVTFNPGGERFGAPRVLPRDAFNSIATQTSGNLYRMNVLVVGADMNNVGYQTLDTNRETAGTTRAISAQLFVATFSPEATFY